MLPDKINDITGNPAPDFHWSPANQRAFLEHLSISGSVTRAARHVNMSPRAAYDLRYRREGAAFKLGWAAAVLIARGRLNDDLLERAIYGFDEESIRSAPDDDGEVIVCRHRTDNKLGMHYLKRLDSMAEGFANNGSELQAAQMIMQEWEDFLDRISGVGSFGESDAEAEIENGEETEIAEISYVAIHNAMLDARGRDMAGIENDALSQKECEVTQNSADFEEVTGADEDRHSTT